MNRSSIFPQAASVPDPEPWVQPESALAQLDALVNGSSGVVFVDAPDTELRSLARHVARLADLRDRELFWADGHVSAEPWLEVVLQLGTPIADAATVARSIAGAGDGVIVVTEQETSRWGTVVSTELARRARLRELAAAVVVLTHRPATMARQLSCSSLSSSDRARFYDVLVEEGRSRASTFDGLASLEGWWRKGRVGALALDEEARTLHRRLTLLGRSCSRALLAELASDGALARLVASGLVRMHHGRAVLTERADVGGSDQGPDASAVADALLRHERDAWALMRVAELRRIAGYGDWGAAISAVRAAPDAASRRDLWTRFEPDLMTSSGAPSLVQIAEVALECGDSEQAQELAHRASAAGEQGFAVAMVLARALRARGDLTAASVALEQAAERATRPEERAAAAVECAEHRLASGQLAAAREQATLAIGAPVAIRLAARNVLGKVLLSEGLWDQAEKHFAGDEQDAMVASLQSERLRARLNRAIAVMSAGRRGEARTLLESVLEEGRKNDDRRARAFALANLSTFATDAHDYGEAIALLEEAIDDVRALGDQVRLSRLIANLAELRLRVGMLDEAEQALAFARQACGPTPGGPTAALLSFVAAHARLCRGHTVQAASEIEDAIRAAVSSSNGGKLSQCCRLATRIALEDGDVGRATRYLDRADQAGSYHDSVADMAVLRATIASAAGRPFADLAANALDAALAAGDVELTRQSHVLSYLSLRDDEPDQAGRHLDAAIKLRDNLASALPALFREGYLGRRELAALAKLEREANAPVTLPPPRPTSPVQPLHQAMARLVGQSEPMVALKSAIEKVGKSDATILIQGESGTGKELVADAIHAASARAGGPLVKINCAALVETLLLSELFGHEKGAFTGASAKRRGRFEQADGGTIFLDEIGDISAKTQVALLRVLQERTFERVGGTTPIRVDVRVICATHRDLAAMVQKGTFREDLYYRLCGVTLATPSLRDRGEDLGALCEALLDRTAHDQDQPSKRLSREAHEALGRHRWPGNVRELENALRAAALFAEGHVIQLDDFTKNVAGLEHLENVATSPVSRTRQRNANPTDVVYSEVVGGGTSLPDLKRALERACIERALSESEGNITKAAKLLGMKRPRLSQLVNQYAREAGGFTATVIDDEEVAS